MAGKQVLDSWKEIADYLKRSVKTCQRIEHKLGLPIHRLADTPKARVFAYKEEIDRWIEKTQHSEKEITVTLGLKKLFIPALVVLVLAVIAFLIFREAGPDLDPNRIVVAIFDNQTGDPKHDTIGRMAADWITQGLTHTGLVEVIPSVSVEKVYSGYKGEDPIRFLAQEMKAGTVISGAYYLQGDSIQFHVQVTDARKGKLLKALDPVSGPIEEPSKLIEVLRQQLMVDMALFSDPSFKEYVEIFYMPPSYEAYKEYREGQKFFASGEFKQAIDHFLKAASLDPDFAQPKLQAAQAYSNLGDIVNFHALVKEVDKLRDKLSPGDRYMLDDHMASLRGDLFGVYQAWVQMAKLSPLPVNLYVVGQKAWRINRPQEAVDLITPVDPVKEGMKDWWIFWWDLTSAHYMLGNHKQELKEARRGRKLLPDHISVLFLELRALAALGKIKEIEEGLNESLTLSPVGVWNHGLVMLLTGQVLRAHGYREASLNVFKRGIRWLESRPKEEAETESHRLILGRTLYYSERWEETQKIYENLHKEFPDSIGYLGRLGALAARRGDREEALSIALQLEKMDRPYLFGQHTFQRARIAALLGEKEQAVELLREAHAQGVKFFVFHYIMDLEPLHDYPPFQKLIKPKG